MTAGEPIRFFEAQLQGEEPPCFETMEKLLLLAEELLARRPWELLEEAQLIIVKDPETGDLCFCVPIGSLGEVFAIKAFVGAEGYRSLRAMENDGIDSVGDFLAMHRSLSVDFVPRRELTVPDRNLLKGLGYKFRQGVPCPIFRSSRPGYHPWYVTEGEARSLAVCARAVIVLYDSLQRIPDASYWTNHSYPLVSAEGVEPRIQQTKPPRFPDPIFKMPELDTARIAPLRTLPRKGVMEIDQIFSAATIGTKNERKACTRLCLAVDAETAIAYPPELAMPERPTGEMLTEALLKGIQASRAIPKAVRVRSREHKMLLSALLAALEINVEVSPALPALDFAKEHLLSMMEGG